MVLHNIFVHHFQIADCSFLTVDQSGNLYNHCQKVTMRSISQIRETYRKSIRLSQIEGQFHRSRILLREVDNQQAMEITQNSQRNLYEALQTDDIKTVGLNLIQLHNIAEQYLIIEHLAKQMRFSPELELVQNGFLPVECSWVELFLILLSSQDELIRQESSALLSHSLFQCRLLLNTKKIKEYEYYAIIQRVLEQFPVELFADSNFKVSLNLLDAFQELLQPEENCQKIIAFLKNQKHIFSMVFGLYKNESFMSFSNFAEKVVNTSLMLLFFVSRNEELNNLPDIQSVEQVVKQELLSKFQKGQHSNILYKQLRALSLSKSKLSKEQFYRIQQILSNQVFNQNTEYLSMLNALVYANEYLLSPISLKTIVQKLFDWIEPKEEKEYSVRQLLAVILQKNLAYYSSRIADTEYDIIIQSWWENNFTLRLSQLLEVAKQQNETLYIILIDVIWSICEILNYPKCHLNQKVKPLQKCEDWSILMKDMSV